MSHLESKRPPGANRRAHNSIDRLLLDKAEFTASAPALQQMRRQWLRRHGVGEPLATIAAQIAFENEEAR